MFMFARSYVAVSLVLLPITSLGVLGCDKDSPSPTAPTAANVPAATNPAPLAGSILMSGTVSDTAYRRLARAKVEVLDGPQAGLTATVDARGGFSMIGLFDETTRFRATVDGHISSTRTLQEFCARCNPNWWINFTLEVPDPPVNVGGDYTLTFTANNTCTMLPEDMRSRTFTATIPATSSAPPAEAFFRVGGATLFEDWDAISIGVAGGYVALWLETLVEQMHQTRSSRLLDKPQRRSGRIRPRSKCHFRVRLNIASRPQRPANMRHSESTHQLTLTRR